MKNLLSSGLILLSLLVHHDAFAAKKKTTGTEPSAFISNYEIPVKSYAYQDIFKYSRDMLSRDDVRLVLREIYKNQITITEAMAAAKGVKAGVLSALPEHMFVLLLQRHPELFPVMDDYLKAIPDPTKDSEKVKALRQEWDEKLKEAFGKPELVEDLRTHAKLDEPRIIYTKKGTTGYRDLQFFANTKMELKNGDVIPPTDLKKVWIDFIAGAEKNISMNVFDFDMMEVADEFIKAAERGVVVRVGLDGNNMAQRPEVQEVYKKLQDAAKRINKNGKNILNVYAVDPVGLSHTKVMARDAGVNGKGAVFFSSGNATHSCSDQLGDLWDLGKTDSRVRPNANHTITFKSDEAAIWAEHEMIKILDMGLRGDEFPLGGAYMFMKETKGKVSPELREHFIAAFSPKGGLGNINEQMISEFVRRRKGPMKALQFAFSSKPVNAALLEAALQEIKETGRFSFKGIGDTPFAGREWSVFLDMIGYMKDPETGLYIPNPESPWAKLPKNVQDELKKSIRAAPSVYGESSITLANGDKRKITAKIHHKILIDDEKGFLGTSFNFSAGAESNNEQIVMWKDQEVIDKGHALYRGLEDESKQSLYEVVNQKNQFISANGGKKGAAEDGAEERRGIAPEPSANCENGVLPIIKKITGRGKKKP